MKKVFILFVGLIGLTLSSFDSNTVKPILYRVTCTDGSQYYFQCDCNLASAQNIGSLICSTPVSAP